MLSELNGVLTGRTNSLFSSKTRDRILRTSLVLFNQRGFRAVTTANIARESGVLEGTLWYHFKSKSDILLAHVELMNRVFISENRSSKSTDLATIVGGVFRSYDLIWDFRYVLRDNFDNLGDDPNNGRLAAQNLNDFIDQWTVDRVLHAKSMGIIQLEADEVESISEITMVLGRYWLDFSSKKYPESTDVDLRKKGVAHIFMILNPYLTPQAKILVDNALESMRVD